jgi:hypothetical protein
MFHGRLDYFQKPPFGCRPNTKPGDHGTPNVNNCWFILLYHVWGLAWIEIHWNSIWLSAWSPMASHYTWGLWPHYTILEVCWDGLWTLSFGLSQFHGHGSWLVCEVALIGLFLEARPCELEQGSYIQQMVGCTLRAGLHHGPWSRTMEHGLFPWSNLMVQLPWSQF